MMLTIPKLPVERFTLEEAMQVVDRWYKNLTSGG
jgi:hypothetical protein